MPLALLPSGDNGRGVGPRLWRQAGPSYAEQEVKTVTEWFREIEGWKREECGCCVGGLVSSYGMDGDFLGPEECRSCAGLGSVWVTPKGHHVLYPGGPFC